MEPIRVIHPPEVLWRAYAIALILLIAGPVLFYEWIRHWPRVAPGEPAVEPNSWIASKSDSRMQAAAAFKPIMDVEIVSDAQPCDSLIGMPVEFTTAGVTGVPDTNGFWVTQVRTPSIFVAFGPNTKRVSVKFGDAVDLTGKVQRVPDLNTIHARWPGLRGRDLERLKKQAVYVEAGEVSITGQY
jgi:hypothetical protein